MADNQTLELPQVFSRTVGPIQPVSVFQGYDPRTMAQVEGPYRGGWSPLMEDPMTYAAMGPTMGLAQMFANAAMQGAPAVIPDRRGWLKIPNTTEPEMGSPPTEYVGRGTHAELTAPTAYAPDTGTRQDPGYGERLDYRALRDASARAAGGMGGPAPPDPRYAALHQMADDWAKLQKQKEAFVRSKMEGATKIPISTYQGKMSAPLPPRWGPEFSDWMKAHASPEGLTVGGHLVPIPEQQPLRIKDADNFYMMPAQGYLPGEDVTFGRPTAPLDTGIQINRAGYATAPGDFTRPLNITDLFKEFPE